MSKKMYFDNEYVESRVLEFQRTKDSAIIVELQPILEKLINGVIAKYKLLRRNYINEDLTQEAWVGLMEVIPKWTKQKGDAFSYFTAVVKNKIFWYLKGQYKDTSFGADEPVCVSLDTSSDLESNQSVEEKLFDQFENGSVDFEDYEICDYVKKLTIEELGMQDNDDNEMILLEIKKKFMSGDNIEYENLIKEMQKETTIPKKKIRLMLDAIYSHFMGD